MKKTIYLFSGLFTAVFSTSSTKDYTCECTYTNTETYTYNGVTQTYTDTYVSATTLKDASRHAAKSNCLNREATYTGGYTNSYGTYSYTQTYSSNCELK